MKPHVLFFVNSDSTYSKVLTPVFDEYGVISNYYTTEQSLHEFTKCNSLLFVSYRWLCSQNSVDTVFQRIIDSCIPTIVFDFFAPFGKLSPQILANVSTVAVSASTISWAEKPFCRSLAGLKSKFAAESTAFNCLDDSWESLIYLDDSPMLIKCTRNSFSNLLLLAGVPFESMESFVVTEAEALRSLFWLSPILLILHNYLAEAIWNTNEALGCFILDDPPLKDEYGFHNINKLAAAIKEKGAASLAVIPWYCNKAEAKSAKIIQDHYPRLSCCVHGCDHTWNEFVTDNEGNALSLIGESIRRMNSLKSIYKINYDPLIVFPQGRFSKCTLAALAKSELQGAINTTLFSYGDSDCISLRELVSPVHVRYGFPVFQRHYPDEPVVTAFALLTGKPIIFGEHHTFFKNGYLSLERLFAINGVDNWTSPANILKSFSQTRVDSKGQIHVRFYSPELLYTPDRNPVLIYFHTRVFIELVETVLVNGISVPYSTEDGVINFSASVIDTKPMHINIRGSGLKKYPEYRKKRQETLRILIRRRLSEFRDSAISKSHLVEATSRFIKKLFK